VVFKETRETKAPREIREHRVTRELRETREPREIREPKETKALKVTREHREIREHRETKALRETRVLKVKREIPVSLVVYALRNRRILTPAELAVRTLALVPRRVNLELYGDVPTQSAFFNAEESHQVEQLGLFLMTSTTTYGHQFPSLALLRRATFTVLWTALE